MLIEYSANMLRTVIEDMDRAMWLDGRKLYYATPRDYRPDLYNVQDIDASDQVYYMLSGINHGNDKIILESLENLKQLSDIFTQYADHVLALIIKDQYGKDNLETKP